jgi:endoglycosylceramidase
MSDLFYCCQGTPENCLKEAELNRKKSSLERCQTFLDHKFDRRQEDSDLLSAPLFISEFGSCSGSSACVKEINMVTEKADQHHASWAYYQYKGFGDYSNQYGNNETLGLYDAKGKIDENKLISLTRSYAPSI